MLLYKGNRSAVQVPMVDCTIWHTLLYTGCQLITDTKMKWITNDKSMFQFSIYMLSNLLYSVKTAKTTNSHQKCVYAYKILSTRWIYLVDVEIG